MRSLVRNEQLISYALLTSASAYTDEYGNETGDLALTYSTPTDMWANVSPAKGASVDKVFGIDEDYSRTITTCDMSCPIKEDSVLWVGTSTSAPYNYVVTQVAKSLNSITYGVKEVSKS